jgi:hypothetical protein
VPIFNGLRRGGVSALSPSAKPNANSTKPCTKAHDVNLLTKHL